MTERDFIYWLQGFLEVAQPESLNKEQIKIINEHIALVLTKVTGFKFNDTLPNTSHMYCCEQYT